MSKGAFCPGVSVLGGLCLGGSLSRGEPPPLVDRMTHTSQNITSLAGDHNSKIDQLKTDAL